MSLLNFTGNKSAFNSDILQINFGIRFLNQLRWRNQGFQGLLVLWRFRKILFQQS